MSQCLRCNKPCEASAVFCEDCRSLLRNEYRQGSISRASDAGADSVSSLVTAKQGTPLLAQEKADPRGDLAHERTAPLNIVETPRSPVTPHPPTAPAFLDTTEQALSRLSEAAQLIAEVEPSNRRLPRASRLAPFRDISADIRRESTPLPKFSRMSNESDSHERRRARTPGSLLSAPIEAPEHGVEVGDSDTALPDFWPWLDSEAEEKEGEDTWANSTDPLISRHIPNSFDSARIEEEDIRRALAEGVPTSHNMVKVRPRRFSSLRMVFAILAILAAIALVADGVLLSVELVHPRRASSSSVSTTAAALTLTPNIVNVKNTTQPVQIHIVNFMPGTSVQLTHNVQESVTTSAGNGVVNVGPNGTADATILVDSSWEVGFDQVYAEDITTHYTAAATLQVIGSEPSKPARLLIANQSGSPFVFSKPLDFGQGIVGSVTTRYLQLTNSGSGSISWTASTNQPWLLVSPSQGMFSRSQAIVVAVQRANLPSLQKSYTGTISIAPSVGSPQVIQVTMSVIPLSPNVGPVLALSPAVLSFTTTDGSSPNPSYQVLTVNNPGTQTLNWSLTINSPATESTQISLAHALGTTGNWLSANQTSGTIAAGSNAQIQVSVNSTSLLPGAYLGSLVFNGTGVADSAQIVSVSLAIQPYCGLVTNAGYLSFTAVQGKTNPSNQALGLNATTSCAGNAINWKAALSSTGWLSVTPGSGTLKGTTSEFLSVGANAAGLSASSRPNYGLIVFTTTKSTQTVMVQLVVQPPPAPNAPVMGASPLNLNFSSTQGQPNPKGQVVTITNNSGTALVWKTGVLQLGSTWLSASPSYGSVAPNATGQMVVNVNTASLSPGTYAGQIILSGTDSSGKIVASGSPQTVSINLVVQPPCTLTQPSASSLAFSGVQGPFNPIPQTLLITGTGNCAWPLTLTVNAPKSAPWLTVQATTSSIKGSGQSASFTVNANITATKLGAGTYNATFTISAVDSAGTVAQSSPQAVAVNLTVLPPCTAASVTPTLTFTVVQGQTTSTAQNVSLGETGTCARPVSWTAVGDVGSNAWLALTQPGADTGKGSVLSVNVNTTGLAAGTYTGKINLSASDNNGQGVGSSSQAITVTLIVTPTYSVSGTVMACSPGPDPLCTTSVPLPGATLTLLNGATSIQIVTADASGNFTFTGVPPGTYTVTISGTDSNSVHYLTSGITLVVAGTATGDILDAYPG